MLAKSEFKLFVTLLVFTLDTPFYTMKVHTLLSCFPMSLIDNLFDQFNLVFSALVTFALPFEILRPLSSSRNFF